MVLVAVLFALLTALSDFFKLICVFILASHVTPDDLNIIFKTNIQSLFKRITCRALSQYSTSTYTYTFKKNRKHNE